MRASWCVNHADIPSYWNCTGAEDEEDYDSLYPRKEDWFDEEDEEDDEEEDDD